MNSSQDWNSAVQCGKENGAQQVAELHEVVFLVLLQLGAVRTKFSLVHSVTVSVV